MLVQDILRDKGNQVHVIGPSATLAEAVDRLVEHNIGSLVVTEGRDVLGIITERDILRSCASCSCNLTAQTVDQHMTRRLLTAGADDEVPRVMGLMTEHRVRHLPIFDGGQLVGIISIGDLVKAQHDQLCLENHYLMNYIQS